MESGLVSIIMPVYDMEQYVAESIQSVKNQLYSNWELIIVNDGSTDKTQEEIDKFVDNRITSFVLSSNCATDTIVAGFSGAGSVAGSSKLFRIPTVRAI